MSRCRIAKATCSSCSTRETLDQNDGAVPATGAADRDGEIGLPRARRGEREAQVLGNDLDEALRRGAREHVLRDRGIEPRQRIGAPRPRRGLGRNRASHDEVGVGRQAVLEAEREQRDVQLRRVEPFAKTRARDRVAELVGGERARVDDPVGLFPQRGEEIPPRAGSRRSSRFLGERVRAPGLAEAPEQRPVGGVEIGDVDAVAAPARVREGAGQLLRGRCARESTPRATREISRCLAEVHEARDQRGR